MNAAPMKKASGENGQCKSVAVHQQPPIATAPIMAMVLTSFVVGAPMASAELLNTHRIAAALAVEAASGPSGSAPGRGT